jgi:hypothetical protein
MARRKANTQGSKKAVAKSIALAERGIHTGSEFASVMAALLTDTIAGRINPQVSNAVCNISGKLLKVVELQYKYGKVVEGQTTRMLTLTPIVQEQTPRIQ